MPPHTAKPAVAVAVSLLALLGTAGAGIAAGDPAAVALTLPGDEAALGVARDRVARADATLENMKRAMSPGRLADPMLDADLPAGLDRLRGDYADALGRVAAYRATLGDRHPTLVSAEQVLADLRAQLLDGFRKAQAGAARDAAAARAAVAALERRAPRTDAAATGSVAAAPHPALPAVRPAAATSGPPAIAAAMAPTRAPAMPDTTGQMLAGLAEGALALLLSGGVGLHVLRSRRRPARPARRRVEPALSAAPDAAAVATGSPGPMEASSMEAVPVLATLPSCADAAVAAGLLATLRAAFAGGPGARMTVLVAAVAGLPADAADAAGLALAQAAAAAGGRALLMEARASGRLRRACVAPEAAPLLVEAGGAVRTLYRVAAGGSTVAVLPSDAGEAEAAAACRPGTPRLQGLAGFDTVVLVGDDAAALAGGADLVLLAAPAGAGAEALASAGGPLRGAGRPCGAVLVERDVVSVPPQAAAPNPVPRLRLVPDAGPAAAAQLGLRGTFEPGRRRLGG